MAAKTTYIYRVELGHNGKIEETKYCYARNERAAKEYYKEKFRDKKYDTFKAVMFGEVQFARHPNLFEEMPQDEINYLVSNNIGNAEAYANIRKGVESNEGNISEC